MKSSLTEITTMRINKIMQDSNGYKLISASTLIYNRKFKPSIGHTVFYDYKDGILREFSPSGYTEYNFITFKRALYNILNDKQFSLYKKLLSTGFAS